MKGGRRKGEMEVGSRNAEVGILKAEVGSRKGEKTEGERVRRWEGEKQGGSEAWKL